MKFNIKLIVFVLVLRNHVNSQRISFERCFYIPAQCPNKDVTFHLYTRAKQSEPVQLNMIQPDSILQANFVKDRPLIILIHGYSGHKDYAPNNLIRPAYFAKDEFNIISLDYKNLALEPCYLTAVSNLPTIANCTAQLLDFLIDQEIVALDSIHVIGFSLGSQLAGMIANFLKKGRKLKRITGLDPAKPLFIRASNDKRLDNGDAEFVEYFFIQQCPEIRLNTKFSSA